LLDAGYRVHLANTAAIKQYEGLKFSNDHVEARFLAHLLRLGILPEGYIYPKAERAVRDLLRKRAQLVRQKVDQMLSIGSQFARHTGRSLSAKGLRNLREAEIESRFADANVALALTSNLRILDTVVKPPGLSSPCAMKCGEGLLTAFGLGFAPHIQRQACTDLALRAYPVDLFLHRTIAPVAPLHRIRCRRQ
jgi:hypothetical protein